MNRAHAHGVSRALVTSALDLRGGALDGAGLQRHTDPAEAGSPVAVAAGMSATAVLQTTHRANPMGIDAALGERIAAALLARDALEDAILLGAYRVDRRIAGTDRLDRFDGTTLADGRPVTIEVVRSEAMNDERFVQRFLRSAQGQCELRHRHIVRALASGLTADGRPVLVRESLSSEPLVQLLARNGWLSWKRVRTIALQLCSALTTARGHGWTAHDLSIAGCVRVRSDRAVDDVRIDGLVSLDELDAGEADERNDVFALGRLVAALVHPSRLGGTLLPPEAEVPAELAEVVATATSPLPSSRYANLTQLGRAISAVGRTAPRARERAGVAPLAGTIHVDEAASRTAEPAIVDTQHHAIAMPRRRARWLVPVAMLLGVVAVGGAYARDPAWIGDGAQMARSLFREAPSPGAADEVIPMASIVSPRLDRAAVPSPSTRSAPPPPPPPPAPTQVLPADREPATTAGHVEAGRARTPPTRRRATRVHRSRPTPPSSAAATPAAVSPELTPEPMPPVTDAPNVESPEPGPESVEAALATDAPTQLSTASTELPDVR